MAVSPISSYSTTRITGLASGMDTESIIANAMKAEQMKYDKLFQTSTKLEWKKDAYTNINSLLSTFRGKYMSSSSTSNLFAPSTYKAYKVNMSDNKYVDIKATSGATASRHSITSVKMAEYAEAQGAKYRSRTVSAASGSGVTSYAVTQGKSLQTGTDEDTLLTNLRDENGDRVFEDIINSGGSEMLSFTVNGKTVTYDLSGAEAGKTLGDLMNDINGSSDSKAVMSLQEKDGKPVLQFAGTERGSDASIKLVDNTTGGGLFGTGGILGTTKADGTVDAKNQITAGSTLEQWQEATGIDLFNGNSQIDFKINGKTITLNKTDTLSSMLSQINSSGAGVTMSYSSSTGAFTLKGDSAGSQVKVENGTGNVFGASSDKVLFAGIEEKTHTNSGSTIDRQTDTIASAAKKMGVTLDVDANGKFSFTVNDKTFSFATNSTIQNMIDTVNGDTDANVTLSYSQITDSFVFSSKNTGDEAEVKLENNGIVQAFGGSGSFFGISEDTVTGSNAEIEIDGEIVSQASNSFQLDGMEFTLKSNFTATETEKSLDFSVSQDVDSVVDKVKAFVEEYNALLDTLYGMVNEEIDYDYSPLTEEQREAMSEAEIEKWETEAKKGTLRNDTTVRGLLSQMRNAMFEKVGDTGLSPFDIGFSTSSFSDVGTATYRISFDEDKFRAALQANPDAVAQVMAATSESTDATVENKESGFISRLFNQMTSTESKIRTQSLVYTNKAISENETQMENLMAKMYEQQERYYQQFAQMETLLSQYQSQSEWLTQQLSSL